MADPFLGQIILFAGPYVPQGWALCAGQILSIPAYQNLFTVLGTTYGGDGVNNFQLPNLINRFPMGTGMDSISKVNTPSGQTGGSNSVTLTLANMPPHTHSLNVASALGSATTTSPQGSYLANSNDGGGSGLVPIYGASTDSTANPGAIGFAGGSSNGALPINIQPLYIAMNYIIAVTGTFLPHFQAGPSTINTTANIDTDAKVVTIQNS